MPSESPKLIIGQYGYSKLLQPVIPVWLDKQVTREKEESMSKTAVRYTPEQAFLMNISTAFRKYERDEITQEGLIQWLNLATEERSRKLAEAEASK